MADTVLIDANIFMYAAGGPHAYREPCRQIVRTLATRGGRLRQSTAVIDAELFQEVAYRYASIGKAEIGRAMQESIRALGLPVIAIDEQVVDVFIELQRRLRASLTSSGPSVRDLLHAAAMQAHGVRTIVTADRDFDALPDIERLDPTEVSSE